MATVATASGVEMDRLQQWVVALTALIVALTTLVPVVIRLWEKVSWLTDRLDNFWTAHLMRGEAEAYQKGLMVETFDGSSPNDESEDDYMPSLAVVPSAHAAFDKIKDGLVSLRDKHPDASNARIADRIEVRYGRWMLKNICMKLGVNQFACIAMAVSIANGIPPAKLSEHD